MENFVNFFLRYWRVSLVYICILRCILLGDIFECDIMMYGSLPSYHIPSRGYGWFSNWTLPFAHIEAQPPTKFRRPPFAWAFIENCIIILYNNWVQFATNSHQPWHRWPNWPDRLLKCIHLCNNLCPNCIQRNFIASLNDSLIHSFPMFIATLKRTPYLFLNPFYLHKPFSHPVPFSHPINLSPHILLPPRNNTSDIKFSTEEIYFLKFSYYLLRDCMYTLLYVYSSECMRSRLCVCIV